MNCSCEIFTNLLGKNTGHYINFGLGFDSGLVDLSYRPFIYNIELNLHSHTNIDTIFTIDLFDNASVFNRIRYIMKQTKFSYLK